VGGGDCTGEVEMPLLRGEALIPMCRLLSWRRDELLDNVVREVVWCLRILRLLVGGSPEERLEEDDSASASRIRPGLNEERLLVLRLMRVLPADLLRLSLVDTSRELIVVGIDEVPYYRVCLKLFLFTVEL